MYQLHLGGGVDADGREVRTPGRQGRRPARARGRRPPAQALRGGEDGRARRPADFYRRVDPKRVVAALGDVASQRTRRRRGDATSARRPASTSPSARESARRERAASTSRAENERLERATPEERLAFAVETWGETLLFTSSFGAGSGVLLHMWSRVAPHLPVVVIDTGFLFDETHRLPRRARAAARAAHRGAPGPECRATTSSGSTAPTSWRATRTSAARRNKVAPLQPYIARSLAWVSGLRRDQSTDARARAHPPADRGRPRQGAPARDDDAAPRRAPTSRRTRSPSTRSRRSATCPSAAGRARSRSPRARTSAPGAGRGTPRPSAASTRSSSPGTPEGSMGRHASRAATLLVGAGASALAARRMPFAQRRRRARRVHDEPDARAGDRRHRLRTHRAGARRAASRRGASARGRACSRRSMGDAIDVGVAGPSAIVYNNARHGAGTLRLLVRLLLGRRVVRRRPRVGHSRAGRTCAARRWRRRRSGRRRTSRCASTCTRTATRPPSAGAT